MITFSCSVNVILLLIVTCFSGIILFKGIESVGLTVGNVLVVFAVVG